MVLYLACTPDKYELPVFVCDTAEEMAAYMGMSKQSIWQMVSRKRKYDRDGKPGNGGRLHLFRVDPDEKTPVCAECGAAFKRRQHNQTYCSPRCRSAMASRVVKKRKEEKHDLQGRNHHRD